MAGTKEVRSRMRAVRQSLKVTEAMKLISTAKLRRARRQLDDVSPYFHSIHDAMHDIIASAGGASSIAWFDRRETKARRRSATVVVSADRGLVGGYNANVIRLAESSCPPGSILMPVGVIGKRHFMEKDYVLLEDFPAGHGIPTVYGAKELTGFVVEQFMSGRIDEFKVVYTSMKSAIKLVPSILPLLPLKTEDFAVDPDETTEPGEYRYLPGEAAVFDALVPQYLTGLIYGTLVESFASEQSARMSAMDAATRNAREVITTLERAYNRARQALITQEITEITAGAASIDG